MNEKFYKNINLSDEYIWFRFDARPNESWEAYSDDDILLDRICKYKIQLISTLDTVIINSKSYIGCQKYLVENKDYQGIYDYYLWLSKDIGIIKIMNKQTEHDDYFEILVN
jgi:hypothetical protein